MSHLVEIQIQIAKLQKQANAIKSREFGKAVAEILVKMQALGITLKDLQLGNRHAGLSKKTKTPVANSVSKVPPKEPAKVAAKYKGPSGEVWSGRGLTPKWLGALVAEGRKKDEFLIKN